ncbi:MAG: hypothetical protein JEZ06_19565 [Anaerolineaceae bacterium]|nr:hypothetical protein [Anaerolineaceae bacterium]
MQNGISTQAWIALGCILAFLLFTNLSLFFSWRNKDKNNNYQVLYKLGEAMRNPFQKENQQYEELSRQIKQLNENQNMSEDEKPD